MAPGESCAGFQCVSGTTCGYTLTCGGYLHVVATCVMIVTVANLVDNTWNYFGSRAGAGYRRREALG